MSTLSVQSITNVTSFDFSNTSFASAYGVANSGFSHSNTTLSHSQTVYAAANSVFGVANGAFGKANTALQNTTGVLAGSLYMTSGSLGVGTTNTAQKLTVYDPQNAALLLTANNQGGYSYVQLENTGSGGRSYQLALGGSAAVNPGCLYVWDATASATRMVINSSGYVGIGTTTPYSTLEITPAAVGWGEGIVINPSSSGYSGIFFRKANTSGSNTTNTWSIGKSTSTPERLQVLENGLTGGQGVDRSDALQQWKTNGDVVFGFNVGIGSGSPCAPLSLMNSGLGTSINFNVNGITNASNRGGLINYWYDIGTYYADIWNWESTGVFRVGTAGTERLKIDSSGRVTTPYQPRFCVRTNVLYNLPASVTEMVHTSVVHNVGNHYSTTTGRFTVPIAGYYRIWTCFHSVHTASGRHVIAVNGSQVTGSGGGVTSSSGDWRQTNLEYQVLLSAGDYVSTFVWSNAYVHGDAAWGNWGAELLG